MPDYATKYPGTVKLEGGGPRYKLTIDDNRQRVLITETDAGLDQLYRAFGQEGFNETVLEYKKPLQIKNGLRKALSDDWDMHVRFIRLHDERIAIDGEVETSTRYVEHNTQDNWISVIYEITDILGKHGIQYSIWHKKMQKYVVGIVNQMQIRMSPLGKIRWKHVAIGAGISIALIVLGWGIKKYLDSKYEEQSF